MVMMAWGTLCGRGEHVCVQLIVAPSSLQREREISRRPSPGPNFSLCSTPSPVGTSDAGYSDPARVSSHPHGVSLVVMTTLWTLYPGMFLIIREVDIQQYSHGCVYVCVCVCADNLLNGLPGKVGKLLGLFSSFHFV